MARHKKRRSAWASISEPERGVFRIRYWATDAKGVYRRMSETVRGTRKEAERRRSELMLLHSEDAPCPTVGEAWERWALPTYQRRFDDGDLSQATLYRYQKVWQTCVAPTWERVPLDGVRPLQVQQWISSMPLTQAKIAVVVLSAVMDAAVRYEVVEHNPMREKYLMPSKSTVRRRDDGIWSLSELGELWSRVRGEWWEPAFLLAAFGSCRVGEALGVMAGDVERRVVRDVPLALVRIERQVPPTGKPLERLKTEQSRRTVVLAGRAAERLCSIAESMPSDWYLSHDGIGHHSGQSRLNDAWLRLGLGRPFKNLRNSWQTWMRWEAKVSPFFIEPMMGHVGQGVTGRHYDKPTASLFADVMADAYLSEPWDARWPI